MAVLAALSVPVGAADIARLEWGSFIVADDNADTGSDTRTVASDDGRSVTMNFPSLEAKVDAGQSEATARVAGHYDLVQPSFDSFASYHVTIEGHVIKSLSAIATLKVRIGDAEQTVEWPAGQPASEKFTRTLDFPAPANGRLPSPFDVAIEAHAGKTAAADEAYLSVSTVTIKAGLSKVASN